LHHCCSFKKEKAGNLKMIACFFVLWGNHLRGIEVQISGGSRLWHCVLVKYRFFLESLTGNGIILITESAGVVLLAIMEGAEPFFLCGGDRGILLVHGFTGSPSEMRQLGESFNRQGYTVMGPRLCGHGTTVEEMALTGWPHWYSAVEDGYHILKCMCKSVVVVGLSMGGLMALKLAAEYPVDKVVSINTPIYLYDRRIRLLPFYRLFRRFAPKKQRNYQVESRYNVSYPATPLTSLNSLLDFIKHVARQLDKIAVPVLVIQSRREHTVKPESARFIYEHLINSPKQLVYLDRSGHVATLDCEREVLFEQISAFI
jgi:carboxylesterase